MGFDCISPGYRQSFCFSLKMFNTKKKQSLLARYNREVLNTQASKRWKGIFTYEPVCY